MSKENKMGVSGMWLPGEVAFNKDLNWNDMQIWWIINSLDCSENHCWASNKYIGETLNIHPITVSTSIRKLKELGYIKQISFNGRVRKLSICSNYIGKYKKLIKDFNGNANIQHKSVPKRRLSRSINSAYGDDLRIEESKSIKIEDSNRSIKINLDNTSPKSEEPPIYKSPEDYSEKVQSLFAHWQRLGIRKHNPSKTRNRGLRELHKSAKKNSIEDITKSMNKYKELLENEYSILTHDNPFKVGLDEFFGFNTHTRNRIKSTYVQLKGVKSWYTECRKADLNHLMYVSKNLYPQITKILREEFKSKINGFNNSSRHENTFRKASRLLMAFHETNKDKLSLQLQKFPGIFAKSLIEFVESTKYKKGGKHPGWLCSDITWEIFPEWLDTKGYTSEDNDILSNYR